MADGLFFSQIPFYHKSIMEQENTQAFAPFHLKEPGSAITHFIGMVLAILATPPLLIHGGQRGMTTLQLTGLSIFLLSMIGLYASSTAYHSFHLTDERDILLQKLDHSMIFVLIAGTYTPICLTALAGNGGDGLLLKVWIVALAGILLKLLWVTHPKWLSSVVYIGMGWLCLTEFPAILSCMNRSGFWWLLAGGILYTVGGVIYALKLEKLNALHPDFGSHEIFHLFVMAGSACHYITMFYL